MGKFKDTISKTRKIINLFIGVLSFLLLGAAFFAYLNPPGDGYLAILILAYAHIILGLARILTAMKTNLPVIFRVQDFCYAALTAIPVFAPLTHKPEMLLGQIITLICLLSTSYWTYYIFSKNECSRRK